MQIGLLDVMPRFTEPFFLENEQREAVTVNGERYRATLNEFLFTKIEEEDIGNTRCFVPCF